MKFGTILINIFFLILPVFLLFILITKEDTKDYRFAEFISEEGVIFTSYHSSWDEDKLRSLYFLLKQNKHGDEFSELKHVNVQAGNKQVGEVIAAGTYLSSTKTITLYNAEKTLFPQEYQYILAHEYGHHFSHSYFGNLRDQDAEWVQFRGLTDVSVHWGKKQKDEIHRWQPEEILAEDYVQLYGIENELNIEQKKQRNTIAGFGPLLTWNDFLSTKSPENLYIPYAGSSENYVAFFETLTGIPIDEERKIKTPILTNVSMNRGFPSFTFDVDPKEHLLYQAEMHWNNAFGIKTGMFGKLLSITSPTASTLTIDTEAVANKRANIFGNSTRPFGKMVLHLKVINPKTNFSFYVQPYFFSIENGSIATTTYSEMPSELTHAKLSRHLNRYLSNLP